MYLAFEFLFYLGLLALGIGIIWLLATLIRRRRSHGMYAAGLLLLGVASIAAPAIYTRIQIVDLGPRLALVNGEKHVTLTGWDGESYAILQSHPETIVLQIANPNVTDETIKNLRGMANLRELDLNDTQVTDVGLAEIAKLTALETLRLRGTAVTDIGLQEHLSRLPRLKRLDLRGTAVTADVIEKWKSDGKARRAYFDKQE